MGNPLKMVYQIYMNNQNDIDTIYKSYCDN